jgi:hypothetical protein
MAEIPSGAMVFEFSGEDEIFDFENFKPPCETVSVERMSVILCLDVNMAANAKGRYTGTASWDFSGDIVGTLMGTASGKLKGKVTGGKSKFKLKTTGVLQVRGVGADTTIKTKCSGPVDTDGFLTTNCTVKLKLAIEGESAKEKVKVIFGAQLGGGPWDITVDVYPTSATRFEGRAEDSFGYLYAVVGKYSRKKDISKVKMRGLKDFRGNGAKVKLRNFWIKFEDPDPDFPDDPLPVHSGAADAKYKVQGYKGVTEVEPVTP